VEKVIETIFMAMFCIFKKPDSWHHQNPINNGKETFVVKTTFYIIYHKAVPKLLEQIARRILLAM
jgi:hypothetical protein